MSLNRVLKIAGNGLPRHRSGKSHGIDGFGRPSYSVLCISTHVLAVPAMPAHRVWRRHVRGLLPVIRGGGWRVMGNAIVSPSHGGGTHDNEHQGHPQDDIAQKRQGMPPLRPECETRQQHGNRCHNQSHNSEAIRLAHDCLPLRHSLSHFNGQSSLARQLASEPNTIGKLAIPRGDRNARAQSIVLYSQSNHGFGAVMTTAEDLTCHPRPHRRRQYGSRQRQSSRRLPRRAPYETRPRRDRDTAGTPVHNFADGPRR